MKSLNTTLGSYMPAFFHMDLSFPFPGGERTLERISEKNMSVFLHEYIHFLQDISTHIGYNNLYVYSEYLHGAVNFIYKLPKGKIKLPITFTNNFANIALNKFINEETAGTMEEIDDFFLTKIKIKKIPVPYTNPFVKKLEKIELCSTKGKRVEFGYRAIMESMAYLIERKISRGSTTPPDYPYFSAEMVVNHLYKDFGDDPLKIIALCDMSLQFSDPAKTFIQTLIKFKEMKFNPTRANDIIDYFYNQCIQMRKSTKFVSDLIKMGFMIGDCLKSYMNGSFFKPFHDLVHTMIGFGIKQRIMNRYFMLDIARNGEFMTNSTLAYCINTVGTPVIKDCNEEYWIIPPIGKEYIFTWLEYFPAIETIYNTLAKKSNICDMLFWCMNSPKEIVDDKCSQEPWSRIKDEVLCPYALLWKHWNLSGYIPFL